ncbi:hypothetical protein OIU85_025226 [Salix viminalis]|uniref:Uncharacterized protein n=1 Tax=Salix viminalis TaxID=40686 RepID=A0A9Q0TKW8_SALVM|nr:hypothetical protein OIU85_025226 [Salix viminalis]
MMYHIHVWAAYTGVCTCVQSCFGLSTCSFMACLLFLNFSKRSCYCKCFSVRADGLKAVPNNHTIDYFSAQPEDSQGKNRAEIYGDDHQRFIHLSAQPGFSEDLSTADTDFEVNDNFHHALDSLQVQPGSSDSSTNRATTDLEMNYKSHQTFDYIKEWPTRHTGQKCKEEREITKAENNRLKTEINRLKEESDRKGSCFKVSRRREEASSAKSSSTGRQPWGRSQNIDLQRENTLLKSRMDQLTSCANNKDNSVILQLQETNEQLQRDKSTLEKIVEALCLKINNDKNYLVVGE